MDRSDFSISAAPALQYVESPLAPNQASVETIFEQAPHVIEGCAMGIGVSKVEERCNLLTYALHMD